MRKIEINFCDFWPGFDPFNNYFYNLLKDYYELEISDNPEFLIYSVHGSDHLQYKCFKIFYCGENYRSNFFECDFSFTRMYESFGGRNYRLPHYVHYDDVNKLTHQKRIEEIKKSKTKFCNIVVSNPHSIERINFFKKLSKYKKVDSGGKVLNNIGGLVEDKMEFMKPYKFTIAFENSKYKGYTTEKIFQPMLVNSIPIYWGNPMVHTDFNTKSFINVSDYKSFDHVIEKLIEIDNDDNLYHKILKEPFLTENKLNSYVDEANVIKQFQHIFSKSSNIIPVARRIKAHFRKIGYYSYLVEKKINWNQYKIKKMINPVIQFLGK